jgi:hypothetical protein
MDGDIIVYQLEPAPEAEYELPTAREYYRELFYRVRYNYSMVFFSDKIQVRLGVPKGLVALTLFFYLIFSTVQSYIQSIPFMQFIHPSQFAEIPLHLLITGHLGGKNLPGMPSRESNSGLSDSKSTHYHLSYAA